MALAHSRVTAQSGVRFASFLFIMAVLLAGCATQRPAVRPAADAPPATVLAYVAELDVLGEDFWRAVRDHDDEGTTRHLADHLKRQPTRELLSHQLEMFTWENGRLKSWQMTSKAIDHAEEHRDYELQCARGVVRARLTFHRTTRRITSVQGARTATYVPAPVAGIEGSVSWAETMVGPVGGTIASPREPAGGKRPAVVLIGESGSWDRDESTGPLRPFRDLGDGLASRGVVTIRFDKRVFAFPEVVGRVFTIDEDLIQEGVSAVAVIRRQPSVDPARVFIIGHGLGGLAAAAIAHRAGGIAGLVLVGVPARPLLYVTLERLRDRDPGEDVVTQAAAEVQSIIDGKASPDAMILGAPATFWYDLAKRDSFEEARSLGRPVLLLRGEADTYATSMDHERWLGELAGLPVRSETVPLVDHLLVSPMLRPITPAEAEDGVGPRVPEYLLDLIADFVAKSSTRSSHRSK